VNAPTTLAQDEAFARIRLLRSPHVGPVSYAQLLRRFGNARTALDALPDLASRGGKDYRAAPLERIEREVAAVRTAGARYLFHDMPGYPELLGQIEGAPPILTVRGDLSLAARTCVAIVGARNASAAAVKLARDFAHALAEAGLVIVSGLARGIDGAAHKGAMPATIGVIASGIDIAYPPQHRDLQERIASEGLLIAEQPPGTEPRGSHFPSRNRIIAGLALGTLVVEAAPRSGSLITARLAGEAGREVMAIPGSPLDARMVRAPVSPFDSQAADDAGDADRRTIVDLLGPVPVAVDELIRQSTLRPAIVQTVLLELELAGRIERHAGGRVSSV
jgi:DNA processing protein